MQINLPNFFAVNLTPAVPLGGALAEEFPSFLSVLRGADPFESAEGSQAPEALDELLDQPESQESNVEDESIDEDLSESFIEIEVACERAVTGPERSVPAQGNQLRSVDFRVEETSGTREATPKPSVAPPAVEDVSREGHSGGSPMRLSSEFFAGPWGSLFEGMVPRPHREPEPFPAEVLDAPASGSELEANPAKLHSLRLDSSMANPLPAARIEVAQTKTETHWAAFSPSSEVKRSVEPSIVAQPIFTDVPLQTARLGGRLVEIQVSRDGFGQAPSSDAEAPVPLEPPDLVAPRDVPFGKPIEPDRLVRTGVQMQAEPLQAQVPTLASKIAGSLVSGERKIIEIVLTPPELGTVEIHVEHESGRALVTFIVERDATLDLLRRHLPLLESELRNFAGEQRALDFAFFERGAESRTKQNAREVRAHWDGMADRAPGDLVGQRPQASGLDLRL